MLLERQEANSSSCVTVNVVQRRPRAVVVVLGHMGQDKSSIARYTKLYHAQECSTVAVSSPVLAYAVNDTTTLGENVITAIRESARLVRMGEWSEMGFGRVPVLLHVLGNGAQLLEEMERRLREVVSPEQLEAMKVCETAPFHACMSKMQSTRSLTNTAISDGSDSEDGGSQTVQPKRQWFAKLLPSTLSEKRRRRRKRKAPVVERVDWERSKSNKCVPRYNPDEAAYQRDLHLFASHLVLGTIVFDSGPYFPSVNRELEAASRLLDGPTKLLAQSAIVGAQGVHGLNYFSSFGYYPSTLKENYKGGRPEQFWKNMENLQLTTRFAFIYSQADPVCSHQKITELIAYHLHRGHAVTECSLVATGHLEHRTRRVDLYKEFVDRVLDTLVGRQLEDDEDEWWSDED